MDFIVQSPTVLIYKNNTRNYLGRVQLTPQINPAGLGTYTLTNVSIGGSINTQAQQCSLSFMVPLTSVGLGRSQFMDLQSADAYWRNMDNIEVWVSPQSSGNYYRVFAGVVTTVNSSIKDNELKIDITCQDYFYWMGLSKLNSKASIFEQTLRGTSKDPHDQLALCATRYTGYTFRDLINRILYSEDEIRLNGLGVIDTGTLMGQLGNTKDLKEQFSDMAANTGGAPEIAPAIEKLQAQKSAGTVVDAAIKKNPDLDITAKQIIPTRSATDAALDKENSRVNRDIIAMYWNFQYLEFMKNNYVSLIAEDHWKAIPYPLSQSDLNIAPLLSVAGSYTTRLEMLNDLSKLSLYEIYQAPQGYVMVKPPMFNAPPLTTISPVEIESVSASFSGDRILTSITTEGVFAAGGVGDDPTNPLNEVSFGDDFPFVFGEYTVLFPQGWSKKYSSEEIADAVYAHRQEFTSDTFEEQDARLSGTKIPAPFQWDISSTEDYLTFIGAVVGLLKDWKKPPIITTQLIIGTEEQGVDLLVDKSSSQDLANKANKFGHIYLFKFFKSLFSEDTLTKITATEAQFDEFFTALSEQYIGVLQQKTCMYTTDVHRLIKHIKGTILKTIPVAAKRSVIAEQVQSLVSYFNSQDFFDEVTACTVDLAFTQTVKTSGLLPEMLTNKSYGTEMVKHSSTGVPGSELEATREVMGHLTEASLSLAETSTAKSQELNESFLPYITAELPFIQVTVRAEGLTSLREETEGRYNVLEHGDRNTKINNRLIRTPAQAVTYSKFALYKHNAEVETTTIVLKTLRPDIVPGWPILNTMDMCVYYVAGIQFSLDAGSSVSTTLTLIAKRKPLFTPQSNTQYADDQQYSKALANPRSRKDIVYWEDLPKDTFTEASPYKLIGWEFYGPNDEFTNDNQGIFIAPFGGHLCERTNKKARSSKGTSASTTKKKVHDYRIVKLQLDQTTGNIGRVGVLLPTVIKQLYASAQVAMARDPQNYQNSGIGKNVDLTELPDIKNTTMAWDIFYSAGVTTRTDYSGVTKRTTIPTSIDKALASKNLDLFDLGGITYSGQLGQSIHFYAGSDFLLVVDAEFDPAAEVVSQETLAGREPVFKVEYKLTSVTVYKHMTLLAQQLRAQCKDYPAIIQAIDAAFVSHYNTLKRLKAEGVEIKYV